MTKLQTEIFVLCDHATVSQDQKLSIIGIFDQFFVANLPTNWPKMYLVAVFKGESAREYPLTLKLTPPAPTDQKLPDREIKVTLGQNGKANLITELVNFPLPLAGLYKVEILSDSQKISELEFKVNKTTATYGGQDLAGKKVAN